jgi:hypothetical protein
VQITPSNSSGFSFAQTSLMELSPCWLCFLCPSTMGHRLPFSPCGPLSSPPAASTLYHLLLAHTDCCVFLNNALLS